MREEDEINWFPRGSAWMEEVPLGGNWLLFDESSSAAYRLLHIFNTYTNSLILLIYSFSTSFVSFSVSSHRGQLGPWGITLFFFTVSCFIRVVSMHENFPKVRNGSIMLIGRSPPPSEIPRDPFIIFFLLWNMHTTDLLSCTNSINTAYNLLIFQRLLYSL